MQHITRRRFTADQYRQMHRSGILDEDDRVELIDGEIVQLSPIGSIHAAQVNRLTQALTHHIAQRAIVSVQNPVHIDVYSEPQTDVAVLKPRPDFFAAAHPTAAEVLLVVEVSDSSITYDRRVKLPLYALAGIPSAWLIDLQRPGTVEVHWQPAGGRFTHVEMIGLEGTLTIPGLPDVAVPAQHVLA